MNTKFLVAGAMALIVPSTLCLTGCSFGLINTVSYQYENADKYTAGDREIDDTITKLNIDYLAGDVKVRGTDTDIIKVDETANTDIDADHQVHTWVDGDTLYVRYCVSTKSINFSKIEKSLEITIPEAQELDDFVIEVSSGCIDLNGFTTENLYSYASSGNMDIDCTATDIEVKSSSGNVGLTQRGNSDSVKVKASSGTIAINHDGDCKSFDIDSSSGKISIMQNGTIDTVNTLNVDVSSGGITLDADEIKDLTTKASSGHSAISLGTVPEISSISCSSGGIEVSIPEDSDVTVHVSISSGEFNYELPFTKDGKNYINGNGTADMNIQCSSGDVSFHKV